MKKYIIYHDNCYDGFGAAWTAWRKFDLNAVYIPASYDQNFEDVIKDIPHGPNSTVYLLDFSFKRDEIVKMRERFGFVFIIDHHKTAEEELKGLPDCIFDMDRSGAVLTWQHFFPNDAVPDFLLYIQDRDLWRFSLLRSKEFSAALRSYPFDFKVWNNIYDQADRLMDEGTHILRHTEQVVSQICDKAYVGRMGSETLPIVNATAYWSEVGHELLRRFVEYPCVASFYINKDRKKVWSLRSRGDFDASNVAKKYGGGGHRNAAGFVEDIRC